MAQIERITKIVFRLRLNLLIKSKMSSPAMAVMIVDKIVGSTSNVAMTKIANDKRATNIAGGKPSPYIAKIKALYTKAKPSSCCMMHSTAGKPIIIPAIT